MGDPAVRWMVSNKRTVWDRIIQIGNDFIHVFCMLMGLLRTDSMHSCVPGDQGG